MGNYDITDISDKNLRNRFIKDLLNDVSALDIMLNEDRFEKGVTRIGAEQEFCLLNEQWRPSDKAQELLAIIKNPHFTPEIAKYNIELNLDPMELYSSCFSTLENSLLSYIKLASEKAEELSCKLLMCGILPTISKNELELNYMYPEKRYELLNESIKKAKGTDMSLHIKGVDELTLKHDSVLFEACNTSLQMHLQIDPEDFITSYNWAQLIAGPVLAISANSPLLLGRELWSETRIALFQQSIDTRRSTYFLKERAARVYLGEDWAYGTPSDLFKQNIAEHKSIIAKKSSENSLNVLFDGKIPKLEALSTLNGTIYQWNRPCYGVYNNKPHLRIENRYIPAGPSLVDGIANFAFWAGLMKGMPEEYKDLSQKMRFKDAKFNFLSAARIGKKTIFNWVDGQYTIQELMEKHLLPIAKKGLESAGIDQSDINRYLLVIERRLKQNNGAEWMVKNYRTLTDDLKKDDALVKLTEAIYINQSENLPVHAWPDIEERKKTTKSAYQIKHIMSTKLFSVQPDDPAAMALKIMKWKKFHHMPVEDGNGKLLGLLTCNHVNDFEEGNVSVKGLNVEDIMIKNVITTHPNAPINEAISEMNERKIGCLPVIEGTELVGIITLNDIKEFRNE